MDGLTLLAEARKAGLVVRAGDCGKLIVRGPRSADALARRLLGRKADVLAALAVPVEPQALPAATTAWQCRCGAMTTVDVPIHDGRSTRRDCARCGRFVAFVRWYGVAR